MTEATSASPPQTGDAAVTALAPGRGMYLRELSVLNFRSCYDTIVRFRDDVTVLVGENNSGKSNVVDAIRLALSPLGGRRTRYFEPGDLSFGRESEAAVIRMVFDGIRAQRCARAKAA